MPFHLLAPAFFPSDRHYLRIYCFRQTLNIRSEHPVSIIGYLTNIKKHTTKHIKRLFFMNPIDMSKDGLSCDLLTLCVLSIVAHYIAAPIDFNPGKSWLCCPSSHPSSQCVNGNCVCAADIFYSVKILQWDFLLTTDWQPRVRDRHCPAA